MRPEARLNNGVATSLTSSTGCQRAPAFNIEGSFFPGWMVCVVFGIIFSVCLGGLLSQVDLERDVKPPILIYPCVALSFALTIWLIFFH
jgi:hypothetical protein